MDRNVIIFLIIAFLAIYEWFYSPTLKNDLLHDRKRLKRNLLYLIASFGTLILLSLSKDFWGRYIVSVFSINDLWTELLALFLLMEFFNYVLHYIKHKSDYLWKFHFMHHKENHYNIWLTAHLHALEVFVSGTMMTLVMLWLGFSELSYTIYLFSYCFINTFQHSNCEQSFGVLERIFVLPRYHKLHHLKGSDCNFGSILTVFDILFGTVIWPQQALASDDFGIDQELSEGFWQESCEFLKLPSEGEKVPNYEL